MARSHLTLAALATSAVSGLDVVGARAHSYQSSGDYDAAVLTRRAGTPLIIRVPTHPSAEYDQSAELVALAAITSGVRSLLPFTIPTVVGQAPVADTRALVYEYIAGSAVAAETVTEPLGTQMAQAVAAVHSLPTAFIEQAGLVSLSAAGIRAEVSALVDRADATHQVPAALLTRWRAALADDDLWQVHPTVVHGSVSTDAFVVADGEVVGVLGWSQLRVDDPARDLVWIRSLVDEAAAASYLAYREARDLTASAGLGLRAALYAELDVAQWLLHGHDTHDEAIVADAVAMMDNMVESVHNEEVEPLSADEAPVLALNEVRDLLGRTPVASTPPQEGLAPLPEEAPAAGSSNDAAGSSNDDWAD